MPTWSDILQWDHTDLTEAAASLSSLRTKLTTSADDAALAGSAVLSSGAGVDQALATLKSLTGNHDDLVNEVSELMMATADAADGVWDVKTRVLECQQYADTHSYLSINDDGTVSCERTSPPPPDEVGTRGGAAGSSVTKYTAENKGRSEDAKELRGMISDAISRAVEVDDAYAERLRALKNGTYTCSETSASNSPGLPDRPQVGWSTTEVATWWRSLTQEERDAIIKDNPEWIGNLDGVDARSRDLANRNRIDEELEKADEAVTNAQVLYDDWQNNYADGQMKNPYLDQLLTAHERKSDLEAIERHAGEHPDHSLLVLDTSGSARVRAAVGVGDVDAAEHVSTYVPGMGTNPADTLDRYVEEADRIRNHAIDQNNGTVATVAWLGYDAPPGLGQPGWTSVTSTSQAEAGADSLNSFTEGINASRAAAGGAEPHQTILGHSYGSTTSGIAVSRAREGVADDLVMFGSPGSGVHDIREYNLGTGQAHVSAVDSNDWVQGAGPDSSFGANPTGLYGINHLSGDAPRPQGINNFNPFARHSNYLMEGAGALEDMAKVVAGKGP